MTDAENSAPADSLGRVRSLLGQATQQLLGATIELTDEQWREPSRLPDWSRGHVATHLARNADALGRLARWARTGDREEMYPSREQRDADIADGSGRPGVELQVDLDGSAGQLEQAFTDLDQTERWDQQVEMRGNPAPARLLPLFRLSEVVLHHVDLGIGFEIGDLEPEQVSWLLEYVGLRLRDREDFPALELHSASGPRVSVGGGDDSDRRTIEGSAADLLAWVTGRSGPERLTGAEGVDLPKFA